MRPGSGTSGPLGGNLISGQHHHGQPGEGVVPAFSPCLDAKTLGKHLFSQPGRALLHVVDPERALTVASACQGPPVGGDQHGLDCLPLAQLHPLELTEANYVLVLLPMGKVQGPQNENAAVVPH